MRRQLWRDGVVTLRLRRVPSAPSTGVEGGIHDEAIEPWRERLPFVEATNVPERADERVLDGILGVGAVGEHPVGEGERTREVPAHELVVRGRVAALHADDEQPLLV